MDLTGVFSESKPANREKVLYLANVIGYSRLEKWELKGISHFNFNQQFAVSFFVYPLS